MWCHSRVLRLVLSVCSLITLSGLHVDGRHSPPLWRALRIWPLLLTIVTTAGNTASLLTAPSAGDLLYGAVYGLAAYHALLLLLLLLRRRRRLHALLRRAAALEAATALCGRPSDFVRFQRGAVAIAVLSVTTVCVWSASLFSGAKPWQHPNYLFPMWVPAALQTPDWFNAIVGLQVLAVVASFAYQSVFDAVLIGLLDSAALGMERLDRYTKRYVTREDALGRDGASLASELKVRPAGDSVDSGLDEKLEVEALDQGPVHLSAASAADNIGSQKDLDDIVGIFTKPRPVDARDGLWLHHPEICPIPDIERGSAGPTSAAVGDTLSAALRDPAGDLETGLERLSEAYRALHCLASEAAEFCSVPTLSLHASVTAVLLVGVYVTINLFIAGGPGAILRISLIIFLTLNTLRVAFVSSAGSRLQTCGERLTTTLVGARWPHRLSPGVRHALRMLVEQTRRPPSFHGGGLFIVRKETMLSMMSFVLTYFVILVQMIRTE
ncbi:hypothetical protein FJT64_005053 [Amphibalanus amphitrite]|uniref:Odorant receptor n=1 Tax=Amphibalanus amphitrite TaxID=1232801 RepID=A0A6A4W6F8_AMPAM|nr:hypothetical protein FJT64_005053 [Amphibalanus amphitrite]